MTYCQECLPEKKQANYGGKGKTPTCCAMHGKAHGFIDVAHTQCKDPRCTKRPNSDFPGGKGTYCRTHKLPEMVDVVSKRCKDVGCTVVNPNFGIKGGKGTHCGKHKLPDMIDVRSKRCEYVECIVVNPVFGFPGGKRTHCRTHKLPKMIDVVSKRCKYAECNVVNPAFGFPGGKGTHCGKHKLPKMVDVRSKRCDHVGCIVRPSFGFPGGKGTHCRTHKLPKMVDVMNKRCKHVGCTVVNPVFGFVRRKGTHCNNHKSDTMVDVMNPRCTSCKTTQTHEKDKLCSACRQVQQLGASRKLIRIERRVIDMLILHGTIIDDERTKFNKSIGAECGGYRPDIYIDCGTFILIIEIDENQHRPRYISRIVNGVVTPMVVGSYSPKCENVRMMSIVSKEQMPVYFIRINPDKCTIDGKDINVSFEKRCEALRALVKSVMEGGTPDAWMTISYLYYDGAILRTEKPDLPAGF